jgi:gamma-glutamylcyclotransferase (GGCT)/AIG2-like uncharacterized protein YtfP
MSERWMRQKKKVRLAAASGRPFNGRVNVFTYGSLMFDCVWCAVTGRMRPSATGRLDGFEAWKIAGQTFPGLAPADGRQVTGRIWQEVAAADLAALDEFESGIYDRVRLTVEGETGQSLECWAYVVRPACRTMLLAEPWDREEFRQKHLADFLKTWPAGRGD